MPAHTPSLSLQTGPVAELLGIEYNAKSGVMRETRIRRYSPILSITIAGVVIIMLFVTTLTMCQTGWVPPQRLLDNLIFSMIALWSVLLVSCSVLKRLGYRMEFLFAEDKDIPQTTLYSERQTSRSFDRMDVMAGILYIGTLVWCSCTFEYVIPDDMRMPIVIAMFLITGVCLFDLRPQDRQ